MYRVFDPVPMIPPGAIMEFDENHYYVVKDGKRITSGDVVEVDTDLTTLSKEKMMLSLARIRSFLRRESKALGGILTDSLQIIAELTTCR